MLILDCSHSTLLDLPNMLFGKHPGSSQNYVYVRLKDRAFFTRYPDLRQTLTLVDRVNIQSIGTKVVYKNHSFS